MTFEVSSPEDAARLATLAAERGFGYAMIGKEPPADALTCGIPTQEAQSIVARTIDTLRAEGGDAIATLDHLHAQTPYALLSLAQIETGLAGRCERTIDLVWMDVESAIGRLIRRDSANGDLSWRDLVIEREYATNPRFRLSPTARAAMDAQGTPPYAGA